MRKSLLGALITLGLRCPGSNDQAILLYVCASVRSSVSMFVCPQTSSCPILFICTRFILHIRYVYSLGQALSGDVNIDNPVTLTLTLADPRRGIACHKHVLK